MRGPPRWAHCSKVGAASAQTAAAAVAAADAAADGAASLAVVAVTA